MRGWSRLLVSAASSLSILLGACVDEPVDDPTQEPLISEDELQRLESLGYLGFGTEAAPESASGVILRKPGCECRGYDLLTYPRLGRAELVDGGGRTLRAWSGAPDFWERATLTADGDLLVVARELVREEDGQSRRRRRVLLRLGFDGETVWKRILPVHHHVEVLPDGRLTTLTSRSRKIPELFGERPMIDNGVAVLSRDGGTIEAERSLFDMIAARPEVFEVRVFQNSKDRPVRDFLHANFLHWMPGGSLARRDPLYDPDNVLVTFRQQDAVAVFDFERSEVVWAWGPGEVVGPHDAEVLENGHVLLFDNRSHARDPREGGWSRVVEIDPLDEEIVWEYRADPPEELYSHSRGTVERLDGGNTLICSSNQGRVFEVTPDGEIVWEYRTPHRDDEGRPAVFRAERYPPSSVDPLLEQARR